MMSFLNDTYTTESYFKGRKLSLLIYGGSHDALIGVRITGLPHGAEADTDKLNDFLSRRSPGRSALTSTRRETDIPEFVSGLDNGTLTGEPLEAILHNRDTDSADYERYRDTPRPSHADYPALMRYGKSADLRGGGRFSGRLTAPLCVAGGICLQLLEARGVRIGAHIESVGEVCDRRFDPVNVAPSEFDDILTRFPPTLDAEASVKMAELINEVRSAGDSVGGIAECAVTGLPAGIGEHMFDGLENAISRMIFAIPGVKGIEFGGGFAGCSMRGSGYNDGYVTDGSTIRTLTNNCGGILGGMSDGMPVIFRVAVKPTPTISLPQRTVSLSNMKNTALTCAGRHDPCILPRVVPVLEAAAALAVYDLWTV